jgi:bla regulator protein blaR1
MEALSQDRDPTAMSETPIAPLQERLPNRNTTLFLITAITILFAVSRLSGQATAERTQTASHAQDESTPVPAFEVATIKPTKDVGGGFQFFFTPNGISIKGVRMQMLLRKAFGVENDRIFGAPGWVRSDRYDIEAKVAESDAPKLDNLTFDQRESMLRTLLANRFNLKVHHETRELPAYVLAIAKGGPKLKVSKPDNPDAQTTMGRGKVEAQGLSLENLIEFLSQQLGRTILDKTGLTGTYDFALHWTPDDAPPQIAAGAESGQPGNDGAPQTNTSPSLVTALEEQLGLKLESQKGPVDVIVVDHVDRPSEN